MVTASGRNGFEAYLLLLIGGWAALVWATGMDGETIAALFTRTGLYIWLAGLIVGSVIALVGIGLGTLTGMMIERAGLYVLAGWFGWVSLAFVGFATRVGSLNLLVVVPLMAMISVISLSRVKQITRDIQRVRQTWANAAGRGGTL
jgi:hypothetical protein